jgi:hypothetical protein
VTRSEIQRFIHLFSLRETVESDGVGGDAIARAGRASEFAASADVEQMTEADKPLVIKVLAIYQREDGPKPPGRPRLQQTRDVLAWARKKLVEIDVPFDT